MSYESVSNGSRDAGHARCECGRQRAPQSPGLAGAGLECVAEALRKFRIKACFPLITLPQLPRWDDWRGFS